MIEHLKSGLSISTHVGCQMGCSYCVLSKLESFKTGPQKIIEPQKIVEVLDSESSLFLNGATPLLINNRTDPLLADVLNDTIELLKCLEEKQVVSPIIIISKFAPPLVLREYFERNNLIYIYSYSNIDTDFNYNKMHHDLIKIKESVPKSHRYHYFRPIIPGRNDNIDAIIQLLNLFYENEFAGSVITGLRVTSENRKLIDLNTSFDPHHKLIQAELFSKIHQKLEENGLRYPLYRHTSCAIANFMREKNKLLYFGKKNHCFESCDNYLVCKKNYTLNAENVISDLKRKFGNDFLFEYNENTINVISDISQEAIAYIKNAYGIKVNAESVILSPSEREILKQ